MDETLAPAAGADTSDARDEGISTVSDGVREMERRERERAAARKAAKADAATEDADEAADEDAGRKPAKRVDDAADAAEDDKPARKPRAAADGDDADEGDDDQSEDDEGDDEDQADESADDEDDEPAKKPAKAEQPPAKVKLTLQGREIEATPEEVSRYVHEAAAERQQVAQARQVLQQRQAQIAEQSRLLAQMAQQIIGEEPDLSLAQSDPGTYIAQQALYRKRLEVYQALQGQHSRAAQELQAAQAQQQQQAFGQLVTREREALLKAMPELADPSKLAAFSGRVAKVAQRYGVTLEELSNSFDHRSYLMLADLARLADMETGRAAAREKLRNAKPLKAPETGASAGPRDTRDIRTKDAKRAFLKSGRSMRDVQDFLRRTER